MPEIKRLSLLLLTLLLTACNIISSAEPGATTTGSPTLRPSLAVSAPGRPVPARTSTPQSPTPSSILRPTETFQPTLQPTETPQPAPPPVETPTPVPPRAEVVYSFPIGIPGRSPGDGFFIRHGYAVENTWYNPGYWHTGEDWYALEGDTAGAEVYAVAAGEVVYVGANYPGRVVIMQHPDGLFSMYGHLDPAVNVQVGQNVQRGALLGMVLRRNDNVPNHLHFEIRTFYTTREVNGEAPRYGFPCGVNCPPGPGYWPMHAPDHPSDLGWRNPTHVIANRALATVDVPTSSDIVVVSQPVSDSITLWSAPPAASTPPAPLADLSIQPGERYKLLNSWTGAEDSRGTGAFAYQLWYHVQLPDGREGWLHTAIPTSFETGSDGRPSTIRFNLLLAVDM